MATLTPTFADVRWGESVYALFDYYQNPIRVGVDAAHPQGQNPVRIVRHGGGGTGGNYSDGRTDAYGEGFFFDAWLLGNHPTTNPAARWDILSFDSGQKSHFDFFTGLQTIFPRSRSLLFPENVLDCQFAIASLKRFGVQCGFNPNKMVGAGSSFGAWLMGHAALFPPIGGPGRRSVLRQGALNTNTHDSTLRGLMFEVGQVDARRTAGVDYLSFENYHGWVGTRYDNSGEWAALSEDVRRALSIRAYFEAGELDGYTGWFVHNVVQGNHVHPFTNPHDSQQHADLVASMQAGGLVEGNGLPAEGAPRRYGQLLRNAGTLDNPNWPSDPPAGALALYQQIEAWMAGQIV